MFLKRIMKMLQKVTAKRYTATCLTSVLMNQHAKHLQRYLAYALCWQLNFEDMFSGSYILVHLVIFGGGARLFTSSRAKRYWVECTGNALGPSKRLFKISRNKSEKWKVADDRSLKQTDGRFDNASTFPRLSGGLVQSIARRQTRLSSIHVLNTDQRTRLSRYTICASYDARVINCEYACA